MLLDAISPAALGAVQGESLRDKAALTLASPALSVEMPTLK